LARQFLLVFNLFNSFQFCFAAQTISRKELLLISFLEQAQEGDGGWCLQVNCEENIAFASTLAQELALKFN
jgi:hypothetical protein